MFCSVAIKTSCPSLRIIGGQLGRIPQILDIERQLNSAEELLMDNLLSTENQELHVYLYSPS